ncbi:MAG: hypothetical protein PVF85_05520 [Anaerolineales bacterium]|jgi:hypothetical protein
MDTYDRLFVLTAFLIQLVLLVYFIIRKFSFNTALKWGWVVYAMAIPALFVSVVMLRTGKPVSFWVGGLLLTGWAILGYVVDIARPIAWRSPPFLPVFVPYVLLYIGAQLFYWFPVGQIGRSYWYLYALLFVASTYFNISSHG